MSPFQDKLLMLLLVLLLFLYNEMLHLQIHLGNSFLIGIPINLFFSKMLGNGDYLRIIVGEMGFFDNFAI